MTTLARGIVARWLLVLTVAGAVAAGCAPAIPAAKFDALAASTRALQGATAETYNRVEDLQRQELAVRVVPTPEWTARSFEPVARATGESFDVRPSLRLREAALDVLVAYTKALHALATRDIEGEVDEAARDLAGSLKSLSDSVVGDKSAAVSTATGVLATVVDIIGREVAARRRLVGLRDAMEKAHPAVVTLSELIAEDNARDITSVVAGIRDRVLTTSNAALKENPPLALRMLMASDVAATMEGATTTTAALAELSRAAQKIPAAHMEILRSLSDRAAPLDALKALVQDAKRIQAFYRSVK